MIDLALDGDIATLRLQHPPVNALDLEFMEAILRGLDEVETSGARALIVTGDGAAFSAGADLFRVLDEGADYIARAGDAMTRLFRRLLVFPKPTVAAVNGHAIAGGSVLVCACDYRVAARGDYRLGFSELSVGVPFPLWALEILRFAVGSQHVRHLALMARTVDVDEALRMGIADEIAAPDQLMERGAAAARRLARVPPETYALTKGALVAPVVERAEGMGPEHDDKVARLWASEEVQRSIRAFLERTIGKGAGLR